MYILINREGVVVDALNEVRYIKLQSGKGLTIACPEKEGTGVIGSDCNTHFTLISADMGNDPNAVTIEQVEELPETYKPYYWIYNPETQVVEPRYSTAIQLREIAYENEAIIEWKGDMITVDAANRLWSAYTAEGKVSVAQELTALIAEAKQKIREMYPDEG